MTFNLLDGLPTWDGNPASYTFTDWHNARECVKMFEAVADAMAKSGKETHERALQMVCEHIRAVMMQRRPGTTLEAANTGLNRIFALAKLPQPGNNN